MVALVNEWQLQSQLNQALQHQQRADFVLWLALLSPRVEDMAQFEPLPLADAVEKPDLYQQLGVRKQRGFAFEATDVHDFALQHQALVQDGFQQWRLQQLLVPGASVIRHDAKKLSADVQQSLGFHTRRRLAQLQQPTEPAVPPMQADPTQLYEILEAMG